MFDSDNSPSDGSFLDNVRDSVRDRASDVLNGEATTTELPDADLAEVEGAASELQRRRTDGEASAITDHIPGANPPAHVPSADSVVRSPVAPAAETQDVMLAEAVTPEPEVVASVGAEPEVVASVGAEPVSAEPELVARVTPQMPDPVAPEAETAAPEIAIAPAVPTRDPNAVTLRVPASAPVLESSYPWSNAASNVGPTAPAASIPQPPAPPAPPAPAVTFAPPASVPNRSIAPPTFDAPVPTGPSSSRGSLGKWLIGGLAALALLGGGIFVGTQLVDTDSEPTEVAAQPTAETRSEDITTSAAPVQTAEDTSSSTPVTSASDVEPVVAVAEAVNQSVVGIRVGSLTSVEGGLGSGIVYSEDGYIVTNAHVVGQFEDAYVTFASGFTVTGVVIGTDDETDVAVLQIDPTGLDLVAAEFANPDDVKVGQLAVAIGSPFGLSQTVTAGIVSSTRRPVEAEPGANRNTNVPMIQTDAPINPGNSGGALVDRDGRIIGMNTLIRTDGVVVGNIGVGFAIVSDIVQKVADGLIAGEPVQPSLLGVSGSDQDVGEQPGAVIGEVDTGTAAAAAGIQSGDRIVMFGGVEIQSMADLAAVVRLSDADVPLPVQLVRDGELLSIIVELQTR